MFHDFMKGFKCQLVLAGENDWPSESKKSRGKIAFIWSLQRALVCLGLLHGYKEWAKRC